MNVGAIGMPYPQSYIAYVVTSPHCFRIRVSRDTSAAVHVKDTDQETIQQLNQKLHLCYLQLSQAVPLIINDTLYAVYTALYSNIAYDKLTFEMATSLQYLDFFMNITDCLAHCFHFFLYFAFSGAFREGFKAKFFG